MKAMFMKAPYQFELREIELPKVGKDEVLLKIMACGICGSDLNGAAYGNKEWKSFGHEISGIVEAVGENVTNVREGEAVAVESGSFCGICDNCRNGRVDLCRAGYGMGKFSNGGFAEYVVVNKQCLVSFSPEKLSFAAASVLEPMGVAMDLVKTTDIHLGDHVAVLGLGPIGIMAVRLAKLSGAGKIYGIVRHPGETDRVKLAREFGVDEFIYTSETPLKEVVLERRLDKMMITGTPDMVSEVIPMMNYGGVISYIGIAEGEHGTITINANQFHFRKLQLRGSFALPALYFPECIQLVQLGMMDLEKLITDRFSLEELPQAMERLRRKDPSQIKMVMVRNGS